MKDEPKTVSENSNIINIGKDAEGNIIVSGDGNVINIFHQKLLRIIYAIISLIIIIIGIIVYLWFIQPKLEKYPINSKEFVRVFGGEYMMGCIIGDTECQDNEKPLHKVEVNSFLIGKYKVTQGQWEEIIGKNSKFQCKDCPVYASWNDVQKFILKLNKKNEKTGKKYRLPKEAEWEFACRSSGKDDRYSGGNDLNQLGWYDSNSQDVIHPVGMKQPNALGIFDMSGNVWEWCEDVYCPDAYENKTCNQLAENDKNAEHVIRGGSWQYSAVNSRCTSRRGHSSVQTADDIGFRLVREDFSDAK